MRSLPQVCSCNKIFFINNATLSRFTQMFFTCHILLYSVKFVWPRVYLLSSSLVTTTSLELHQIVSLIMPHWVEPHWCSSLVIFLFSALLYSVKFETPNNTSNYSGYAWVSDCWSWAINETFKVCTVCWRGTSWGYFLIMFDPAILIYCYTLFLMLILVQFCFINIQVTYPTAPAARQQASWSLDDLPRTVAFTMHQGSSITSMDFHPSHRTLLLGMIRIYIFIP